MLEATLRHIAWQQYHALFFDSLTGAARTTAHASFGARGTYDTRLASKLAFVQDVVNVVRNPQRTGHDAPYLVFTNIYDPLGRTVAKDW